MGFPANLRFVRQGIEIETRMWRKTVANRFVQIKWKQYKNFSFYGGTHKEWNTEAADGLTLLPIHTARSASITLLLIF
ncbi:unnamed protein product [Prunus armeniaca]|nr:unnamed protein product [Prunus armeniaca]